MYETLQIEGLLSTCGNDLIRRKNGFHTVSVRTGTGKVAFIWVQCSKQARQVLTTLYQQQHIE
jgi:hypothetical protein